jgi:hypothetical protein
MSLHYYTQRCQFGIETQTTYYCLLIGPIHQDAMVW